MPDEVKYKTREDLEEYIKAMLGFPVVDVELEEQQIKIAIEDALDDIDGYVNHSVFVTKSAPNSGRIDMSDDGVDYIIQVYKVPVKGQDRLVMPYANLEEYTLMNTDNVSVEFEDRVFRAYLNRRVINTLKEPMSYRWVEPYLYIDQGYPRVKKVTIEYAPYISEIEELPRGKWYNIVKRLALAKSKYMLGRIRGKFDVSNSPFSLDGNDLVQEGKQEEEDILQEIKDDADTFHPL